MFGIAATVGTGKKFRDIRIPPPAAPIGKSGGWAVHFSTRKQESIGR
jgi:hypothetical protein